MEVVLKYRQYHRFINRGFLIGPWLPIYGSGVTAVTVVIGWLARFEDSYAFTFLVSFLLCGSLEYAVSWYLEYKFHARWWDYSKKPMNLKGRVWIGNLILFGLAGTAIVKLVDPVFFAMTERIAPTVRTGLAIVLACVFIADAIMSHFVMKLIRGGIESSEADNTEEITKEIRLLVSDKSVFHKRLVEAYPEVVYNTDRVKQRVREAREAAENLYQDLSEHLNEERTQFVENHIPMTFIKDDMIEAQEALIEALENGATDAETLAVLRGEVERQRERMNRRSGLITRIAERVRSADHAE